MTDRELLELAAKAAGYEVFEATWCKGFFCRYIGEVDKDGERANTPWNPLKDDGDALRLACSLGLSIYPIARTTTGQSCSAVGTASRGRLSEVICSTDTLAATRCAIVRAAAEIGRAMP